MAIELDKGLLRQLCEAGLPPEHVAEAMYIAHEYRQAIDSADRAEAETINATERIGELRRQCQHWAIKDRDDSTKKCSICGAVLDSGSGVWM